MDHLAPTDGPTQLRIPNGPSPIAWVLHDGKAGMAAEKERFPALAEMPRPILSVLIGGTSRAYRLTLERLGEIAEMLVTILRTDGGSVLLTGSRRTGAPGLALLRRRLKGLSA